MLTPSDEESLLLDINEGVQHALYLGKEDGRFSESEIRLDRIRLNKLQYLVNEKYSLGLTFGWFKYGPAPEDVTTGAETAFIPKPGDDIAQLEESRLPGKDHLSTEAFAYYFLKDLDDEFDRIVTAEETKTYLADFYDQYAPADEYAARFTDLYKRSVRLQQTLDTVGDGRDWHQSSTKMYYDLDKSLTSVIEEAESLESLKHTIPPLDMYKELLLSIISEADAEDELSSAQQAFIENAVRKFYNTIWDFVAHEISLETMRGENVNDFRHNVMITAENYRDGSWRLELKSLAERRESVGLAPEIEDIEEIGSDRSEGSDEQPLDEEIIDSISEMGAEVISD